MNARLLPQDAPQLFKLVSPAPAGGRILSKARQGDLVVENRKHPRKQVTAPIAFQIVHSDSTRCGALRLANE